MTTIINIWEYFDKQTLRYEHYYAYLIASDVAYLVNPFFKFKKQWVFSWPSLDALSAFLSMSSTTIEFEKLF